MKTWTSIVLLASLQVVAWGCNKPGKGPASDNPASDSPVTPEQALELVDLFTGTARWPGSKAHLSPAAQVPNGMVRLGPHSFDDTGDNLVNDYFFESAAIQGFSHLRIPGISQLREEPPLGTLSVLPVRHLSRPEPPPRGHHEPIDKTTEDASPGFYTVALPDAGVTAELTASAHAGMHRYSAPQPGITLLFDPGAGSSQGYDEPSVTMSISGDTIEGHVVLSDHIGVPGVGPSGPTTRTITFYFSATMNPAPTQVARWESFCWVDQPDPPCGFTGDPASLDVQDVVRTGLALDFHSAAVELRVGFSLVDLDQARAHRVQELDSQTFEEVREQAANAWADKLGRVRVGGGTLEDQQTLYTALYNVWRFPTRYDGIDGRYMGLDGQVAQAVDHGYYGDLLPWDTAHTLHPWLTLVDPELHRDVLRSLMAMHDAIGHFPRSTLATLDTGPRYGRGTPVDLVFADAAAKGLDGIDYAQAFDRLLATATSDPPQEAIEANGADNPDFGRKGGQAYIDNGYVPCTLYEDETALSFEYMQLDWGLANLANTMGRSEASALMARSGGWQQFVDPSRNELVPLDDTGAFINIDEGYGPGTSLGCLYSNLTAWRDFPLWQGDSLVEARGGAQAVRDALVERFTSSPRLNAPASEQTDYDYWYNHDRSYERNAVFLFHHTGHPADLGRWLRTIQATHYGPGPGGFRLRDGAGALSSWYAFSALGLMPLAGSDTYMTSPPVFPYAQIDLADGKTLTIEAPNASPETYVIEQATINGESVDGYKISHSQLSGATLRYDLSTASP